MMTKLYIIGKILTFPGAYIKGFWEQLTCRILGLPVEVPGYLRIDEACGHVEHAFAKKGFASYLMATGPGFMNFITGVAALYRRASLTCATWASLPTIRAALYPLCAYALCGRFAALQRFPAHGGYPELLVYRL